MEFLLFLQEHWRIVVILAIDLAILLVSIFKRRIKVVDNIYEYILKILPGWIKQAESLYSSGSDKKAFVITMVSSLLEKEFHIKDFEPYLDFVSSNIEKILSTPQKKGV